MADNADLESQVFALAMKEKGAISYFYDHLDSEDVGLADGRAGANQFYVALKTFHGKTGLDPIEPISFRHWLETESEIYSALGGEDGVTFFLNELDKIDDLSTPEAATSVLSYMANKKRQSAYMAELQKLLEKKDKTDADSTQIRLLTSKINAIEDKDARDPFANLMTGDDFAERADHLWDLPDFLSTQYPDLNKVLGYSDRGGIAKGAVTAILAQSGRGKALALDTPIPTPDGWLSMGDIKIGDRVFDENGNPCNVVNLSEIHHNNRCFKVTISDGSYVIADAGHQWKVHRIGQWTDWKVKTTEEILDFVGKGTIRVPRQGCLSYESDSSLPIDPYVLGIWLGDGESRGARFTTRLKDLNVFGNKHIPEMYLRSNYGDRISLLQGLMDSDGSVSIDPKGDSSIEFSNKNERLAMNVIELSRSLGIKTSLSMGRATLYGKDCGVRYRVRMKTSLPIFRLPRKKELHESSSTDGFYRTIRSIEEVASVPTKCIEVDSVNHLFLAGHGMIPTHNSTFAKGLTNHWVENGHRVLYVNYEEAEDHWSRILMTQVTGKNVYRGDSMNDLDKEHYTGEFKDKMRSWGDNLMVLQDPDTAYFEDLESLLRSIGLSEKVPDAIVIDTIQSMFMKSGSGSQRWNQYEEMMVRLEKLAKELGSAIIITAQENTNRIKENRTTIKASDTGGSIAIVQKCSATIHLVDREMMGEIVEEGLVDILIPKNRITGQVYMDDPPTVRYNDETKSFENYERIDKEDDGYSDGYYHMEDGVYTL